jgi:hypothetical protein
MNLKGCCDDESKSQYCYSYILGCAEVPISANYLVVTRYSSLDPVMLLNKAYYTFKFLVPRPLQIRLRRYYVNRKRSLHAKDWPIDHNAGKPPEGWSGWPDGKKFALVLTHDVETAEGLDKCYQLAELEERLGFRSSYNFVPWDYTVPAKLRKHLTDSGFEIGICPLFLVRYSHENQIASPCSGSIA